jgi:hypothetical protein
MKIALTILGVLLASFAATAQLAVEVVLDQTEFLPSETIPAAVRITNRSGQPLHLGADANWLTFNVESADGLIVVKSAEVPVLGEFDLGSSEVATKRVDLAPYFGLTRPGRYRVTATVQIKDWNQAIPSRPEDFFVIVGAKIWAQDFGVPSPAGRAPEARRYTLEKANYLHRQLRLYVQVSDPDEVHIFKVISVGQSVAFGDPDAQLDHLSNLHLMFQSGASYFTYAVVNPDGELVKQEIYDYVKARPRLALNDDGTVTVIGGVHRANPEPMPMVKSPDELGTTNQ